MVGTNRGGIETYLLKMNQNMSENTIFDYVIEEETCLHEEAITSRNGQIHYISARSKNPIRNIKDNYRLLKSVRGSIGAVYFNLSSLSWIFPIIIARLFGYKVFVHAHNSQFDKSNSTYLHKSVNFISKWVISKMNIERLTCSRPASLFMFKDISKVKMIYNAIEVEQYLFNEQKRNEIRARLNLVNKKVIGFVGRLTDPKNPFFMLQIVKDTLSFDKDVVLLLLGDGPLKLEIEQKIRKLEIEGQCILMGNQPNVQDYLQAMDVFILPSLREGLPYVAVEAQAAGLCCLISNNVTNEVKAVESLKFLPINEGTKCWTEEIVKVLNGTQTDRRVQGQIMLSSNFNIARESKHLETLLTRTINNE